MMITTATENQRRAGHPHIDDLPELIIARYR